jgi:catechol 2,3-dioxygenase-like lactoylglutathione lyase family enzyme
MSNGRETVLKDSPVVTTLPVTDPARARRFYAEKLGLTPTEPDGDFYECGDGTKFVISTMGFKPGGHTQMAFAVKDIAATVKELRAKGIRFEEYDSGTLKTVDGVADQGDLKAAWFKDSEGNMIGIMQPLSGSVLRFAFASTAIR